MPFPRIFPPVMDGRMEWCRPLTRSSTRLGRHIALLLLLLEIPSSSLRRISLRRVTSATQVGSLSFDTTTTPVLENFNWTVDTVTFTDTDYEVFEMDNLTLSSVPEPSTLIALSLLGALAITIGQWRRKRNDE